MGEEETNDVKLRNADTTFHQSDDLTTLPVLNEAEIVRALERRFFRDRQIFTYAGRILLTMNPSGVIVPGVNSQKIIQKYTDNIRRRIDLSLSTSASSNSNEASSSNTITSILISGEAGSGKTETARMILNCLAHKPGDLLSFPLRNFCILISSPRQSRCLGHPFRRDQQYGYERQRAKSKVPRNNVLSFVVLFLLLYVLNA